ncbi:PH domain-containing protein [Streptomyces sp. NPDC058741]|uniref:PH domain-containing protein n=1 Tax=Streptomyces sp. NPDC058741 TaxID=3346620 RepID=UPI00368D0A56
MTSPEPQSPTPPSEPESGDRVHRSAPAIAGGVLLIGVVGWIGIDALLVGEGRTPWLALAVMLLVVPLIVAFTLRPAVYTNEDRLRIRNPFRVIVVPWGEVAALRSAYSNEVLTASGAKYQLWAVPVSLRARKRAARREMRATAEARRHVGRDEGRGGGPGTRPGPGGGRPLSEEPVRAANDRIVDDLRALHEKRQGAESAQGPVTVRWAYEVMGPAAAGAVLVLVLLAVG